MTDSWTNDLMVAAALVKSIKTLDHELNYELQLLADQIEDFADVANKEDIAPIPGFRSEKHSDRS